MNWETASESDLHRLEVIKSFLSHQPHLLRYLFQPERPALHSSPEVLLANSSGFCTADKILIRVALQLWCEYGELNLTELFCLDGEVFLKVLEAIKRLGPKPSPWYQILNQNPVEN